MTQWFGYLRMVILRKENSMTQEHFVELQNLAMMQTVQDPTNDFYTILQSMIEDYELEE